MLPEYGTFDKVLDFYCFVIVFTCLCSVLVFVNFCFFVLYLCSRDSFIIGTRTVEPARCYYYYYYYYIIIYFSSCK